MSAIELLEKVKLDLAHVPAEEREKFFDGVLALEEAIWAEGSICLARTSRGAKWLRTRVGQTEGHTTRTNPLRQGKRTTARHVAPTFFLVLGRAPHARPPQI